MNALVNVKQSQVVVREFNGMEFKFREDGYFNMTHAANLFEKQLPNFWSSPDTISYKEALSNAISSSLESKPLELVEIVPGNRYTEGRGTWAHPKLATFFARWLDPRFAVFCDMVIDDLMHGHAVVTVVNEEKAISPKLPQTYIESLQELITSLQEQERLQGLVQEKEQVIAIAAPKAEFYDRFISSSTVIGIRDAASNMNIHRGAISPCPSTLYALQAVPYSNVA